MMRSTADALYVSAKRKHRGDQRVNPAQVQGKGQMTKSSLHFDQRRIVHVIEVLRFGSIERLVIRGGLPCYEPEPVVVQVIKLDSEPPGQPEPDDADLTLKKEFESLFNQLLALGDAVVDIEIRHGLPFKLAPKRRYKELL